MKNPITAKNKTKLKAAMFMLLADMAVTIMIARGIVSTSYQTRAINNLFIFSPLLIFIEYTTWHYY